MQRESSPSSPSDSLVNQLAALSPEKRALLELRLKKQAPHARGTHPISRRTNVDAAPLSFAGLWGE